MNLKLTHVRLLVGDYQKAFDFYSVKLGLAARFSDPKSGYGEFDTGAVTLALFDRATMASALGSSGETPANVGSGRPVLIFAVEEVDIAWRELQARGVSFLALPTDRTEWTIRTAHFSDPDGNLIEINSPIKRHS